MMWILEIEGAILRKSANGGAVHKGLFLLSEQTLFILDIASNPVNACVSPRSSMGCFRLASNAIPGSSSWQVHDRLFHPTD